MLGRRNMLNRGGKLRRGRQPHDNEGIWEDVPTGPAGRGGNEWEKAYQAKLEGIV